MADTDASAVWQDIEQGLRVAPDVGGGQDDERAGVRFVDWAEFWDRERNEPEWLVDDILARGRGHSVYAQHKTGKSLVMLWCALRATKAGALVIYLDFEMGDEDLHERLSDMGYGPETDLSPLRYALLPSLPSLDTPQGGSALMEVVDREMSEHPGQHVCVIIDTIGRATSGEENASDTFLAFYRHTGIALKQRGVTWARLDHAGWDASKGARGTSAKGDDVDVIWQLKRTDDGYEFELKAARMGWVPAKVPLSMSEGPLRLTPTACSWPAGTTEVARLLDRLGIPADASTRTVQQALKATGESRRRQVVVAAMRYRKDPSYAHQKSENHPPEPPREPLPRLDAEPPPEPESEFPF